MASELIVQTLKGPTSGANANKVIVPSGQTLDASAGGFTTPAGHVIQTIEAGASVFSPRFTTSSTSYISTGYALSITPSNANNKILITCHFSAHSNTGYVYGMFYRNATALTRSEWAMGGGGNPWGMAGSVFLDSPNTTEAVTYTLYGRTSTGTAYIGWSSSFTPPSTNMCHILIQEIAG